MNADFKKMFNIIRILATHCAGKNVDTVIIYKPNKTQNLVQKFQVLIQNIEILISKKQVENMNNRQVTQFFNLEMIVKNWFTNFLIYINMTETL